MHLVLISILAVASSIKIILLYLITPLAIQINYFQVYILYVYKYIFIKFI